MGGYGRHRRQWVNRGKWLRHMTKFFVVFFGAILGVDQAQNLVKYKRWLCVLIQLTITSIAIM